MSNPESQEQQKTDTPKSVMKAIQYTNIKAGIPKQKNRFLKQDPPMSSI
jgi:hypothetical protein